MSSRGMSSGFLSRGMFPQAGLPPGQRLKPTNFPEQPTALPVRPEEQCRWVQHLHFWFPRLFCTDLLLVEWLKPDFYPESSLLGGAVLTVPLVVCEGSGGHLLL